MSKRLSYGQILTCGSRHEEGQRTRWFSQGRTPANYAVSRGAESGRQFQVSAPNAQPGCGSTRTVSAGDCGRGSRTRQRWDKVERLRRAQSTKKSNKTPITTRPDYLAVGGLPCAFFT